MISIIPMLKIRNIRFLSLSLPLVLLSLTTISVKAQAQNMTVRTTRFVQINGKNVTSGQSLQSGEKLQTRKRSRAEVRMGEGVLLSLLSQTDIVFNGNIVTLGTGTLYVKTTQPLTVQTQETTATISSGAISITALADGSVTITSVNATVEVERATKKRTLKPGQQVTITLDRENPKRAPRPVWGEILDVQNPGVVE